MNLKHGFDSRNTGINPDCQMIGCAIPTSQELAFAERFLFGDACSDPTFAHGIVKAIYLGGKRKYPTLWEKANQYVNSAEYVTLERLSACNVTIN